MDQPNQSERAFDSDGLSTSWRTLRQEMASVQVTLEALERQMASTLAASDKFLAEVQRLESELERLSDGR